MIGLLTSAVVLASMVPAAVLDAGPLKVEVHASASSQLFYVVDQMSGWSLYCHPQFRRRLGPFSAAEETLLQKHAAVRKAHGWGALEIVFYPAEDWRGAIDKAVKDRRLTKSEADTEREVLSYFSPKVTAFTEAQRPMIEKAVTGLRGRTTELAGFAHKVARFTGQQGDLRLPLYLVPSPEKESGGGGANGGVLVVEVAEGADPYFTLVHEAWHAFVDQQGSALDAAVKSTPGLDRTLLGEGMAYVIHPGLFHPGTGDALLQRVRGDLKEARTNTDERFRRYAMFNRFALALRPLLSAALDDPNETLARFLPRACDVFRSLQSLSPALDAPALHGIFLFGPKLSSLWDRVVAQRINVWGRNHDAKGYEVLAKAQPGDVVLLLFTSAELSAGVPDGVRDLLPASMSDVKGALDAGKTFEAEAARRQWRVILLAAPDQDRLAEAARTSDRIKSFMPTAGNQ
jgi:hypothetical protein